MFDPYRPYMTKTLETPFSDHPIDSVSAEALLPFSSAGVFTKSFDVTVKGKEEFREIFILSSTAKYECANGGMPLIQFRLIDNAGEILYYSPAYEIGHTREFYRREWRIPPIIDRYDTLRISFFLPEDCRLYIREFKVKRNHRIREGNLGVLYHAHAGVPGYAPSNTVFGFQMAAEMGFTSCITIPKFTKDGVGICFHDDDSVRKLVRYEDGSMVQEGSPDDKPICDFTYEELMKFDVGRKKSSIYTGMKMPTLDEFFRICSMTGMDPIFSVHPALTHDEWEYVRHLLIKYRLLERFRIKAGSPSTQRVAREVFDDDIGGYILIQGAKSNWDPAEQAKACLLDPARHRVITEYFGTAPEVEDKIRLARSEGFFTSVAAMKGGVSGPGMRILMDLGVSEFTLDHHCSMGLDW